MKLTLFDLDGTLIPQDSDHAFGEFAIALGWADADAFRRRNDGFYADYLAGRLDIDAYVDFATAPWRARPAAELEAASARFLDQVVRPMLLPQALALVRRHQDAGDLVAIVTATNEFVTRPIARLFGVDELIATELERDAGGRVTGAIRGVPSFREGKVARLQAWLAQRGLARADFETSTFYSDSTNDLPLLEWVTAPVATNPGPALERIADERGWPVLKLFT
ncbi:MAG: HAD family hydrolase [Burkholderiales bacterium]|nr:HAD-IB family hydrolase [Burkholderiales bacterium]MDE1928795.1 HAD family hydrolase [Burkholderiales bacterium]MDE2158159.1 HAD family hydrolase [Burkholderiales bacterium]MDE2504887.1 HAD family hydrolase [Burkholderiales bacterium]